MAQKPAPKRRKAPWRGRARVTDPKARVSTMRWTASDYAVVEASAQEAGLKVGPYLRALALGSPGPRAQRRATADREVLARILAEVGKLGSNVNQIARVANTVRDPPRGRELPLMQQDIAAMRAELMRALGRGDGH